MKRIAYLAAVLAALALSLCGSPPTASANLRLVTKQVAWLNTNRWGCGSYNCVPNDTVYVGISSTKVDTTVDFSTGDMVPVPFPASSSASDTLRTIAKFVVVSDSVAAGTVTVTTMTVQGVAQTAAGLPTNLTTIPLPQPGQALCSIAKNFTSGSRILEFPIFSSAVQGNGSGVTGTNYTSPWLWPNWRVTLSSTTGTAGQLRAYVMYYVDQ